VADTVMDEVIRLLREMYAVQYRTDEEGGREVAAWYWQDQLEEALGVQLLDIDEPEQWLP
jgi:hypothetical protein